MSDTRSRRVSMTQLLHLWEFLNTNKDIAVGYNKSIQARQHSKQMWERAADILNSFGEGAIKPASEWSKYWVDMKARLKKKNRLIMDSRRRTGGGPGTNLQLTEIERKFLSIVREDLGCGLPGVRVEPPGPLVLESYGDIVASPTDMDNSQSTAEEDPIYLEVLSSEEYQQSQVNASQHSAHTPVINDVPPNPQPSPITENIMGRGSRERLASDEAESSPRLRTAEQGPTRRRRRQRQQLSAAEARARLVLSAETRAQAELTNSRSIERAVNYLGEIVSILRNIADSNAVARGAQQDPAL